jgi:uncharacterized protein (TIGR02302 family)
MRRRYGAKIMTRKSDKPQTQRPDRPQGRSAKKLRRRPGEAAVFIARLVLFWERAWPAALPALSIPYLLAVISLFGMWRGVPLWLHGGALGLALIAFVLMLRRDFAGFHLPTRRDAQMRLERDGGVAHAPLQALDDRPFMPTPAAASLWAAHLRASAERARKARLAGVRPTADRRDPWGLRYTALGLLAVAAVAAGGDWRPRLAATFLPTTDSGAVVADLWIEPPAYTGKAPVYLMRANKNGKSLGEQIDVPAGSRLVAQINGRGKPRLRYIARNDESRVAFERQGAAARGELALNDSGLLRFRNGPQTVDWPIGVIADNPPTVRHVAPPHATDDGRVAFSFISDDEYALSGARLELRLDGAQARPLDAPAFDDAALSTTRTIALDGAAGPPGEHAFTLDLQADPWAGLQVVARVIVVDGAGQTGAAPETRLTLPVRAFFNPLAKTVIEQRQTLAVAANDWRRVGRSFDAVTLAPEAFFDDASNYLLLRAAFWRVMRQNDDGFDDAVEKFWPLALQLEDEALELARQRLEAAEDALRQALEQGADDDEIARLIEELREAMDDYLTALAQSGERSAAERPPGEDSQELSQSELDQMLDAIRDLAQSGADAAARQMLSELENLLQNLRMAQRAGGQQGGQTGQGEEGAAGKAGDLIGRQRALADEAFERSRQGAESAGDLADEQGALGDEVGELMDRLESGGGDDPNGEAGRALGRAQNQMREAQQALDDGDFGGASNAMERAIDNLRDSAETLAREQMRAAQEEGESGDGGGRDPLGRPSGGSLGDGVDVPPESEAARARAVIDELRRRLGEPGRPEAEIDYLERLLERF